MLFVDLPFFLFFAVVFTLYWWLPGMRPRKLLLLAASYFFYAWFDWRFALLLLALSIADWLLARRIAGTEDPRRRRLYLLLSLCFSLGVLAFFKYALFLLGNLVWLAHVLHARYPQAAFLHPQHRPFVVRILLPVGISFFTFQSIAYVVEVYRRAIAPVARLTDYLLYSAFFPQLVAGPISRPQWMLPQLAAPRTWDAAEARRCLLLFLVGYAKKVCLADNVSPFVDLVFAAPHAYTGHTAVLAAWLYTLQIYCDFSGYTDMALAVAGLLGYRLAINFDAPYLATSIQDFWRRWHISLSTWIRDYIYFPLGGARNRRRWMTYRNLLIAMLLAGLWHGAAWTFIAWGGLHGLALAAHQRFARSAQARSAQARWRQGLAWLATLNFVALAWVLFRAPDFPTATYLMARYVTLGFDTPAAGTATLPAWLWMLGPVLLACEWALRRVRAFDRAATLAPVRFALLYGAGWAVALAMLPLGYRPFIYFQF